MELTFTSPTDSKTLTAEVDPSMTAKTVLAELIGADFLPGQTAYSAYTLVPTSGRAMLSTQTLSSAGVKNGEVIEVVQATRGAA